MLSIARTIASLVGSGLLATAATAAVGQDTASLWREIARGDAEAALEMIEENHPGARAEVGDAEFQARLESAREHVGERLPHVANYEGYSALMLGLANDFGDGHIWSSAILSANRVDWPGLVAERRAGRWVIGHDLNEGGELSGAELVSCDGKAADAVGRERIGQFRAAPDVEADLASNAYALFIDDGNPFLQRPANCTFRLAGGAEVTRPLPWRTVSTAQVQRDIGGSPAAGSGRDGCRKVRWRLLDRVAVALARSRGGRRRGGALAGGTAGGTDGRYRLARQRRWQFGLQFQHRGAARGAGGHAGHR
jgi:hypothetical protein